MMGAPADFDVRREVRMRCNVCHGHVVFERTVFEGTAPKTVRLCEPCADSIDVMSHLDAIKAAPNHEAKTAAVSGFITAVETATAEAQSSSS
jgi:hypothetical protein